MKKIIKYLIYIAPATFLWWYIVYDGKVCDVKPSQIESIVVAFTSAIWFVYTLQISDLIKENKI